jgi:hypothetical protein
VDDVSYEDEYQQQHDISADMMVNEFSDFADWKNIAHSWGTVNFGSTYFGSQFHSLL